MPRDDTPYTVRTVMNITTEELYRRVLLIPDVREAAATALITSSATNNTPVPTSEKVPA